MTLAQLTKLFDFPCHYADLVDGEPTAHCWHIRRGFCESSYDCPSLPVYRQAIADHRCARVLDLIKRWWWDRHYPPTIFTGVSGDSGAVRVARFRALINGALNKAGL